MLDPLDNSHRFALDTRDLGQLRHAAREDSPEALKAVAKQFEAMFMNMLLKSMREATPGDGIFDNEQTRMYTTMLDQQLSQTMASRGIGLADVLVRQLSGSMGSDPMATGAPRAGVPFVAPMPAPAPAPAPASASAAAAWVAAMSEQARPNTAQPEHVRAFQQRLAPHAEEASRMTGIPARFMLGQAALESGWGKREIVGADGTRSHNLFGIKATGGWKGRVVETTTTEYVNGVPEKRVEKFRAYDSYAEAFRDYARLLRSNPRYENVIANARDVHGFAQGLQKAGYATDPNYAAKLTRIITQSLSS
ncbi:MAG TPA: flagellar assembly peptidoglycan hydrolase FlgJ [Noviherbaspirillum sp.]|nr:flagellar assembly peptidoglycan hydrolase FlgJ [Noviherbaspirillum sp.]